MNEFADALTNVPDGYRVAAARYGASSAQGYDPLLSRMGLTRASMTIVVNGNVYGVDDIAALLAAAQGRASFNSTGLVAAPSLATATAVGSLSVQARAAAAGF